MREHSSAWTFFYKFVFPTLWIGMFSVGTLLMFISPDSFQGSGNVREVRWVFGGATLVGTALIYWSCIRLKKVGLGRDTLSISNYRRQIEVALGDIEQVSGSLLGPELIWLSFRRPTILGTEVVFMPKLRLRLGFSRHPLVAVRGLVFNATRHA